MKNFLEALRDRVLVCDGAMGTMLYSKGVFISRCFDELNVSNPALVRSVHEEYVSAGADIIETNAFGASRIKLMNFGLADQFREINIQGARIARAAAGDNVFVAGAIGPLGIRIAPWGKTGIDEAAAMFREQAEALLEGGVDLFILETFSDLNEVQAAIAGVHQVSELPVVAQMSIEEDGNSLEGTPPEVFSKRLEDWGVEVIGLNCSVGPQMMLDSIERIANVATKHLSVQPNAGRPRSIEGRNIYLCSPEYMASYAKRFIRHGVRIVGGCCGTGPEHIRAISGAVKATGAGSTESVAPSMSSGVVQTSSSMATPLPLVERSKLARKIGRGEFVRMVGMIPPTGHDYAQAIEAAKFLKAHDVDVVNIPDAPRSSARMSAVSLAILLEKSTDIESLTYYTCGDRNLLGMQADLLGAYALGLRNLLLITGDPPHVGDATAVYDVDSIGLTNLVHGLNQGIDVGGKSIGSPTGFLIGVGVNPGSIATDNDNNDELRRFHYKVEAGADFALTQPVFDVAVLEKFLRRIEDCRIPVIVGILPLANYKTAEFLHYEVPGFSVPEAIRERMRRAQNAEEARAEGIRIAQATLEQVQGLVQGVEIRGPFDEYATAIEILSALSIRGVSR
jgi:homocysteine S-methyltransferase